MEDRYRAMSALGVRNIAGYNRAADRGGAQGPWADAQVQTGIDPRRAGRPSRTRRSDLTPLPFIVVIIDEMADLMLVRARRSRRPSSGSRPDGAAAGIHVIMATQRPRSTSFTAPSRPTSRPASPSTSRRRSTAAPSWASRAASSAGQGDMLYHGRRGKMRGCTARSSATPSRGGGRHLRARASRPTSNRH